MKWSAIVPLNIGRERKTRLAGRFGEAARARLAEAMARHVLATLREVAAIDRILVLSPEQPAHGGVEWLCDREGGLNAELAAHAAVRRGNLLVIHGDLPLLEAGDIAALLDAADGAGVAIAPDRHGAGTNALALRADRKLAFAFGADSFARHLANAGEAVIVRRPGLALDVDAPDDFDSALAAGWVCGTEDQER